MMLMHRAKKLTGISPSAWEHPADRAALAILRQAAGLDELVKMLVGGTTERSIRLLHVSSSVKVTATQFTKVKNIVDRVMDVMDWPAVPDVFVTNNPFFNAGTFGVKEPFIVLNSATLRSLDDDELYCVVAHEAGHVLSGHALYKTVLWILMSTTLGVLPIAGMLVRPLILALREWDRKSELTADRAALLALQSEMENYHVLMKMAGGEDLSQMNVNDFFQQAWEYENQKTLLDGIFKMLNTTSVSHPFPVVRLQELRSWASSGEYQAILAGAYARRGGEKASASDDVRAGYEYYRQSVHHSEDPLLKGVKKAGESLGTATEGLRDAVKDIFRKEK